MVELLVRKVFSEPKPFMELQNPNVGSQSKASCGLAVIGSQCSSCVCSNHPKPAQTSTMLCLLSQKEMMMCHLGEICLSILGLWNVVDHRVSHKISQGRWRTLKFWILVGTGGGENPVNPPACVPLTGLTTDRIWFWLFGVCSKQQLLQGGKQHWGSGTLWNLQRF